MMGLYYCSGTNAISSFGDYIDAPSRRDAIQLFFTKHGVRPHLVACIRRARK